jgi:hypothetical protein
VRREGKKLAQLARCWARGELEQADPDHDPQADYNEALAAFGLQLAAEPEAAPGAVDKLYLWPCNQQAWGLWLRLQSQWRVGGSGQRTGLDYAGALAYLHDVAHIKPKNLPGLFSGLQAMEFAALRAWAEQQQSG